MPRLVALDAAGADFVAAPTAAWEAGDPRLPGGWGAGGPLPPGRPVRPAHARDQLLARLRAGGDVEAGDALVVATSGTTGGPKGAGLPHDALAAAAQATSRRLEVDPKTDRWLACISLAHVGGLGVVARALV